MSSSSVAEVAVARKKERVLWWIVYSSTLLLLFGVLLYTLLNRFQNVNLDGESVVTPVFISQASPLFKPAPETLDQASQLPQNSDLTMGLPLLASVIKNGDNKELQSKAALMAGMALAAKSDESANAIAILRYALASFPDQSTVPSARYQLALLYIGGGKLSQAQSLLTKLLRDTPDTAFSSSAAFLAAKSAEIMETNDRSANHRLANFLANLLPPQTGAIGGVLATVLMTLISTYLSHKDKITKGNTATITLVIALTILTLYNGVSNFNSQHRQMEALATTATRK